MATRLDFQFAPGKGELPNRRRAPIDPLRILVIGDLRGAARAPSASAPLADARVVGIDIDNFDRVLSSYAPAVELSLPGHTEVERFAFRALSDFHPDALYDASEAIGALRRTRERLLDPRTFESEKARLSSGAASAATADTPSTPSAAESAGDTLSRLLGPRSAASVPAPVAVTPEAGIDALLRRIVAPHVIKTPGPEQTRLTASVDAAITSELRAILHAPAFQQLEALWRGVHWLVNDNPAGEEVQLSLLDVSRAEVEADLRACGGEIARSELYRRVVDGETKVAGAKPFTLILSDFGVDGSEADVSLLAGLGAVAAHAGGVLLGVAHPCLVGAPQLSSAAHRGSWGEPDPRAQERMDLLRASAVAPFIGLAMPRVIGRLPYGKRSDPISRHDFAELPTGPAHEDFLWLNPAFACARLVVDAFAQQGWNLQLGAQLELSGLPAAIFHDGHDPQLKPCAEVLLDEGSAGAILARGYMPLVSHRQEGALTLPRFQSIANPPAPLAGPFR